MKNKIRFWLAGPLGITAGVVVWIQLSTLDHTFIHLTLSGISRNIVAGICGGFVSGLVSPYRKISVAALAGCLLAAVLLSFMLKHGFSHLGRNPFLWYWPVYLPVFFTMGGFLARGLWTQHDGQNKSR